MSRIEHEESKPFTWERVIMTRVKLCVKDCRSAYRVTNKNLSLLFFLHSLLSVFNREFWGHTSWQQLANYLFVFEKFRKRETMWLAMRTIRSFTRANLLIRCVSFYDLIYDQTLITDSLLQFNATARMQMLALHFSEPQITTCERNYCDGGATRSPPSFLFTTSWHWKASLII